MHSPKNLKYSCKFHRAETYNFGLAGSESSPMEVANTENSSWSPKSRATRARTIMKGSASEGSPRAFRTILRRMAKGFRGKDRLPLVSCLNWAIWSAVKSFSSFAIIRDTCPALSMTTIDSEGGAATAMWQSTAMEMAGSKTKASFMFLI